MPTPHCRPNNARRLFWAAMVLLAGGMAGCAQVGKDAEVKPTPMWPMPPELPRFIYEGTLRNSHSLVDEGDGAAFRRSLTGGDTVRQVMNKPYAVAARHGRVYVSDTEAGRIIVFDIPRRRIFPLGVRFEGALKRPAGVAVDGAGNVYVVDRAVRRLVVYDALGLYQREVNGGKDWVRPSGVAVDASGRRIFIVDTGGVESDKHVVYQYDAAGKLVRVIGRRGDGPGEFNLPTDAAVAPDGTLYVLDSGNFRVQAFDEEGKFLRSFGSVGNALGQLARPRGLAVDRDGVIYVSDSFFGNVQAFNANGELLLPLGRRGAEDAPGVYSLPAGVASDETGRLYVVDQYFHKVEVLRRLSEAEGHRLRQEPSEAGRSTAR